MWVGVVRGEGCEWSMVLVLLVLAVVVVKFAQTNK